MFRLPIRNRNARHAKEERKARGWADGRKQNPWFADYRADSRRNYDIPYTTPKNSVLSDDEYWRSSQFFGRSLNTESLPHLRQNSLRRELKLRRQRLSNENEHFLKSDIDTLGREWAGVKVNGRGGQGVVGLWEYKGEEDSPGGRRVVVKETLCYGNLRHERNMMNHVGRSGANHHVVRLIYHKEGNILGRIDRLILEYCEGGDVRVELRERRKR
jgi:hypothetical protein